MSKFFEVLHWCPAPDLHQCACGLKADTSREVMWLEDWQEPQQLVVLEDIALVSHRDRFERDLWNVTIVESGAILSDSCWQLPTREDAEAQAIAIAAQVGHAKLIKDIEMWQAIVPELIRSQESRSDA